MLPPMEEVYAGRSIFITGASGFVGKSVLFNQLRRTFPQRLRKVVVIEGDISEDDFGISEENLKRVLSETSVVFHCAATVRFDDKLKKAADLNIRGVRRMVSLCQRMPKLDAFLHCSTAFANSDKPGSNITETLHPIDCDAHKLLTALENLEDSQINLIAGDLIKNHPNLYCFTKLLGEQIIVRDASNLPALIFRPSIISPVWKDGIPGWSDAFQGLTAMLGAVSDYVECETNFICSQRYSGAIPRYPMHSINPKTIMDCVPIDVVTSMMIYAMQYPTERLLSPPSFTLRGFPAIESYRHKFRATYVGPAMDGFSSILRQPPMWTKIYNKLRSAYEALIPFAQFYHFESPSIDKLKAMMTDDDKKIFDFDVRKIKWDDYGCDLIMGMKTFLMKDDVVDAHKIRLAKMNLLSHQLMGLLPLYAICYFISEVVTG
ncbi:hypothetical protein PRIPAC_75666 [Pristionchus pacificus]|nr:hypothetical protein PRIPAC_75666 [Pristionchus pacificus]